MGKTTKAAESSLLYRKIDELGLSATERAEALAALKSADTLADGIYWVFTKLGRITAPLAPTGNLKHQ